MLLLDYQQILKLKPTYSWAFAGCGEIHMRLQKFMDAIPMFHYFLETTWMMYGREVN